MHHLIVDNCSIITARHKSAKGRVKGVCSSLPLKNIRRYSRRHNARTGTGARVSSEVRLPAANDEISRLAKRSLRRTDSARWPLNPQPLAH